MMLKAIPTALRLISPVILIVMIGFFAAFFVFTRFYATHYYSVEARTGFVSLFPARKISEQSNHVLDSSSIWTMKAGIRCLPVTTINDTQLSNERCSKRGETEQSIKTRVHIKWPLYDHITVTSADGGIRLGLEPWDADPDLPVSAIYLDKDEWQRAGALNYRGGVQIGDNLASGVQNFLSSGRYEARALTFSQSLTRWVTRTWSWMAQGDSHVLSNLPVSLKSGIFTAGDVVEVMDVDGNLSVVNTALVAVPGVGQSGTINIFATSAGGRSQLVVRRHGVASAVKVLWFDRAFSDPLLIGLATLLGFMNLVINALSGCGVTAGTIAKALSPMVPRQRLSAIAERTRRFRSGPPGPPRDPGTRPPP